MSKTAITNGYRFTFTPQSALKDGAKAIEITAADNDGNAATTVSATFTVDTIPPTLTISEPASGLITNQSNQIIKGITNDATSSPVTVVIVHGSKTYEPAVDDTGAFTQAVVLTEGTNTIKVTAMDAAGKVTEITLTVSLDTTVPTVKSVVMSPNPANVSGSVVITLEVE
jgi:hypothetical protein